MESIYLGVDSVNTHRDRPEVGPPAGLRKRMHQQAPAVFLPDPLLWRSHNSASSCHCFRTSTRIAVRKPPCRPSQLTFKTWCLVSDRLINLSVWPSPCHDSFAHPPTPVWLKSQIGKHFYWSSQCFFFLTRVPWTILLLYLRAKGKRTCECCCCSNLLISIFFPSTFIYCILQCFLWILPFAVVYLKTVLLYETHTGRL